MMNIIIGQEKIAIIEAILITEAEELLQNIDQSTLQATFAIEKDETSVQVQRNASGFQKAGEITSQRSGDVTGESTGSDKDPHRKPRTYMKSNVENSCVHIDIRRNNNCNIYKKIQDIVKRNSNNLICIKKNDSNGEQEQLSKISIASCDKNTNSAVKNEYFADNKKNLRNSCYLVNELNNCRDSVGACNSEDNSYNTIASADVSNQPIAETDNNFVNKEKIERSDNHELEEENNHLDKEIQTKYEPSRLAASGYETEIDSVDMDIGSPVESLGNETESGSVAMELETDEEKDDQEDYKFARESCVNVPRPFTSILDHANNLQKYETSVSLQNAYLNQHWSHQFHPMPSSFINVHSIQSSLPLAPQFCYPLGMNMQRPVAELAQANVVGNMDVPYFNCQYGPPQMVTKEIWCDSFLQNSSGFGVPIQGAPNYWYNDLGKPTVNPLEATYLRTELETPVTTEPGNPPTTESQLYISTESGVSRTAVAESPEIGEANPCVASCPGASTTGQPEPLKTSKPEQFHTTEPNTIEVVTSDLKQSGAKERDPFLTTKGKSPGTSEPESLRTTKSKSLGTTKAKSSGTTKPASPGNTKPEFSWNTKAHLSFVINKSQPPVTTKAQPTDPAKTQPPELALEARPLELAKAQPLNPSKSLPPGPAKAQPSEIAKAQPLKPSKSRPPGSAKAQLSELAKAKPLKHAKSQQSGLAKVQPLEPAKVQPTKSQSQEPVKVKQLEPTKEQPSKPVKVQQPESAKAHAVEPIIAETPDSAKVQLEPARAQTPETMKAQPLKPSRVQPSEDTTEKQPETSRTQPLTTTKIQPPEATKAQPLETTKAEPPEVTKVLLPGITISQAMAQQPTGTTKSWAPETSKSQLPGPLEPTNINCCIVEVERLSNLKEFEQIVKAKKVLKENSSETNCTTRSLALCREKQNSNDTVMLIDDTDRISGSNRRRGDIPTSASPLEIKYSISESVQKSKIETNLTEDNTICNDIPDDGTVSKETGIFIYETTKPETKNDMSLDVSLITCDYQKLPGIMETKPKSSDSKDRVTHDGGNVISDICSDTSAARNSIFSSLESLKSSLGAFTAFDKIANEVILSTVMSLENVLKKAAFVSDDSQNDLGGPQTKHSINKVNDNSDNGNANKIVEGCNMIDDPKQIVGSCMGDRSAKNQSSNSRYCQGACKGLTRKKKEHQLDKKKVNLAKKGFHFAVYNPDGDPECEAVKNYLLCAGGFLIDTSNTDNLANIHGELRVFIRRKHTSSIHRVGNLYRLKMLQSVKFSLFKSLSDVTEKSRAHETIFPVGGVVIPDDTVLCNSSPAEVSALFLFMKELRCVQQRLLWVMHLSRRAYKKIVPVRPATLEGSQTMNLIRSYRMDGFVHLLSKDYVAEKVAPAQSYLDTVLKQQVELMKQYRHFVLLADHRERKQEEWFVARGIGVFTIREFLHAFAGEKEAEKFLRMAKEELKKETPAGNSESRKVLLRSVSDGGNEQQNGHSRDNAETEVQKLLTCNRKDSEHIREHRQLERERVAEHKRILEKENGLERNKRALEIPQVSEHHRGGLSTEPVTSCNSDRAKRHRSHIGAPKTNMKETRLEILSSLKNRRDALVNKSCVNQGRVVVLKQPHCETSVATATPLQDMTDSCMRWP